MPLHSKEDIREDLLADNYGSADVSQPLPKYRMPSKETDARVAYSVVEDELMLDGNSRQNLATFCQTWLDDEIHKIMNACVAYFVGDRMLRMNSVINAGACARGRNSTPSLKAMLDQSKSQVAAVPYPVSYALTTVLALIGGYVAQLLS